MLVETPSRRYWVLPPDGQEAARFTAKEPAGWMIALGWREATPDEAKWIEDQQELLKLRAAGGRPGKDKT